eukprot:scaffold214348_cov53-Attheya_sp.AAC.1
MPTAATHTTPQRNQPGEPGAKPNLTSTQNTKWKQWKSGKIIGNIFHTHYNAILVKRQSTRTTHKNPDENGDTKAERKLTLCSTCVTSTSETHELTKWNKVCIHIQQLASHTY